jgi:hypothetical protein
LHLIIVVAPLFPTLRQLGHFFILGDDHWRVNLMFEFISNVWYIQTLRYAAQWSFLNETMTFLVLGPNTWWYQMLCIWMYGWWPGDFVHPELATLIKLDSIVSIWMEILIFFLGFLSHSKCWHCTLIMPWSLLSNWSVIPPIQHCSVQVTDSVVKQYFWSSFCADFISTQCFVLGE